MSTRELTCIGCRSGVHHSYHGRIYRHRRYRQYLPKRRRLRQKRSHESDPHRNIDGPGERRHLPDGKRENSLRYSERQDFRLCQRLKDVTVNAPLKIGDVVLSDVAGTGVDIIAARNVPAK